MFSRFPTDRTIFFSDAVFAIAMTLLILEIKLPTQEEVLAMGVQSTLAKRIPNFMGFAISFFVTALFWRGHMQTCAHVRTITNRFVWLNIVLLFFVVLLPFTTALYSNFGYNSNFAFGLYALNLALIGLFNFFILQEVIKTEDLKSQVHALTIRWTNLRTLTVPVIFVACMLIAPMFPLVARYGFILIFVIHGIGDRIHKTKLAAFEVRQS